MYNVREEMSKYLVNIGIVKSMKQLNKLSYQKVLKIYLEMVEKEKKFAIH